MVYGALLTMISMKINDSSLAQIKRSIKDVVCFQNQHMMANG